MRHGLARKAVPLLFLTLTWLLISSAARGQLPKQVGAATDAKPEAAESLSITATPEKLDFGSRPVDSTSPVQTIIVSVTAKPDRQVRVTAISGGDFRALSPTCDLKGSAACAIGVTFAPSQAGPTSSTLTLSLSDAAIPITKMVGLTGLGVAQCKDCTADARAKILTRTGFNALTPALITVLLYLAGIILIRWNLIARPTRSLLQGEIVAVRTRLDSLNVMKGPEPTRGIAQIQVLLSKADELVRDKSFFVMLPDYILWNRGQELSAWNCVHEAEEQMALLLPPELVQAELEQAELDLRQLTLPVALGLADRIKAVLDEFKAQHEVTLERLRALLNEALGFLYDRADINFASLISWHNKTIWLIGCALLLIVSLGAALQHELFFLVGAAGGLLSRLSRSLQREDVPTDYGASWTTLFLSPVVGALAGWCGVLLLIVASELNIIGSFLKIDWCNPYCAVALGAALLFGTSERAFDNILSQLEEKVKAQTTATKGSQPADSSKK